MKRREILVSVLLTYEKERRGDYMANAVAARDYGDQYQALVLGKRA